MASSWPVRGECTIFWSGGSSIAYFSGDRGVVSSVHAAITPRVMGVGEEGKGYRATILTVLGGIGLHKVLYLTWTPGFANKTHIFLVYVAYIAASRFRRSRYKFAMKGPSIWIYKQKHKSLRISTVRPYLYFHSRRITCPRPLAPAPLGETLTNADLSLNEPRISREAQASFWGEESRSKCEIERDWSPLKMAMRPLNIHDLHCVCDNV